MRSTMKQWMLVLALGIWSATAAAGVINFDDLPGDYTKPIPDAYRGLNWTNMGAIGADAFPGSGYEAGTVSRSNAAYNLDGGTAAISVAGEGAFNFVGAYFTSAWFDQELAFEGYRNGELMYSTLASFVIDTVTPLWIQLGWSGIDTLVIYNSSATQWAMDDMVVPEPASLALFGAAAIGLSLARRRRRGGGAPISAPGALG